MKRQRLRPRGQHGWPAPVAGGADRGNGRIHSLAAVGRAAERLYFGNYEVEPLSTMR